MSEIDCAIAIRPLLGNISDCGDTGRIIKCDGRYFLALVDVLGHGAEARRVAVSAEKYLDSHFGSELLSVMEGLQRCLTGTRGAVAALFFFDPETEEYAYTGIGNITVRIFGYKPASLIPKDGIVGFGSVRTKLVTGKLSRGDTLLMHSDGIKEHFDVLDCAGLFAKDAREIADGILAKFGKKSDDASCIVFKYLK